MKQRNENGVIGTGVAMGSFAANAMNSRLTSDAEIRPELFARNGAIAEEAVDAWMRERGLELPDDLVALWRATGGGELFESETILGPLVRAGFGDDVDGVNDLHRARGLSPAYLIVHLGTVMTAIRTTDRSWVTLHPESYEVVDEFESLDDWYLRKIRSEFAERYRLPIT